jgi:hypothetical protein
MKKIIFALAMVPMLARAEVAQGTFELSGGSNLGFSSGSRKTEIGGASGTVDTTDYGLSATGLYYVSPNIGIGGRLEYGYSAEKANGVTDGLSTLIIGPAIAAEAPVAPQFAVFGLAQLGYASTTQSTTGFADVKASGYGFGLDVGVKYFVVKNFSFNAALAYQYANVETDETVKRKITTSDVGLNLGLSVYFGGAGH